MHEPVSQSYEATWPGLLSLQPDQPPSPLTQALAAAVGMQGGSSEHDVLQAFLLPQLGAIMCSQAAWDEGLAGQVQAVVQQSQLKQQQAWFALRTQPAIQPSSTGSVSTSPPDTQLAALVPRICCNPACTNL